MAVKKVLRKVRKVVKRPRVVAVQEVVEDEEVEDVPEVVDAVPEEEEFSAEEEVGTPDGKKRRLWEDDDEGMRRQKEVGWAAVEEPEKDDDEISDEEDIRKVLQTTEPVTGRKKVIPPGTLDYQVLADGNKPEYSEAALSAVDFHPNGNILLTAAPDYRLRLFQTDGTASTKLQTIRFKDMPLRNAKFTPSGVKIVCTAARPNYAIVDVESSKVNLVKGFGQDERNHSVFSLSPVENHIAFSSATGSTHIVSLATHQTLFSVKGDGPCNASCYVPNNPNQLMTAGGSKVYVWDIRTRRPLRIHEDEGSNLITSLDVTGNKYAVGSANGVVNVYDLPSMWGEDPLARPPAPRKALMPLTTEASFTKFNPQGELLCIGSIKKKNSVRIVHGPTLTTFSNFPRVGHHYRKPTCVAFSPGSGLLCLGNDRGHALLLRMAHYDNV